MGRDGKTMMEEKRWKRKEYEDQGCERGEEEESERRQTTKHVKTQGWRREGKKGRKNREEKYK